jgi:hypothetical protein
MFNIIPPAIILSFMAGCVVTVLPKPIPWAKRAVGPLEWKEYKLKHLCKTVFIHYKFRKKRKKNNSHSHFLNGGVATKVYSYCYLFLCLKYHVQKCQ